jgi:hypothetical protein
MNKINNEGEFIYGDIPKFEPENWDTLDKKTRIKQYAEYVEYIGGLDRSKCISTKKEIAKGNYWFSYVDYFDIQNLKDEDNLYKKLKGYICLHRRYIEHHGYKRPEYLTEEFFQENMNDFRQLLKENIDEIIMNLGGTKWPASIMKCFFDSGTKKEKIQVVVLASLLQLSRVDFLRTRSFYSEDSLTALKNSNWLDKYILPLEDKSFENIVSAFFDDNNPHGLFRYKDDVLKMLKEI